MGRRDSNKPRGRMSSYAFFVQTCREEHKKKHPGESVVFAEFTKKCAEKWKSMGPKEKRRFEEMAERDKARYEQEMSTYVPSKGDAKGKKRRKTKDPNAPKRALSAFFFFCNEERPRVKADNPGKGVAEVAKELGKRWETCKNKDKYENLAARDKDRYEKELAAYKSGNKKLLPSKAGGASAAKKGKRDDDDEEDEEDEEEEEEEEEEEDDEEDDEDE